MNVACVGDLLALVLERLVLDPLDHSCLLELAFSLHLIQVRAVDCGVLEDGVHGEVGADEDHDEGAEEKEEDDESRDERLLHPLHRRVVPIFPNDVSWFRGRFNLYLMIT